jgi:hypothetical protein
MRLFALAAAAAALTALAGPAPAQDKGSVVELAGMKSTTPADWKQETPTSTMRLTQFKLPKAEGDKEDAELALFVFPGGSGTVQQNLDRQVAKFEKAAGKDKVEQKVDKIKVGTIEATYQDVAGTYIKKPFPMAEKGIAIPDYRQLYVVFESKDGKQYYMTLLGPAKTVEKHKKAFEEWLKNFK